MQIDPYQSLCTKFNSKWIKSLNIKPDTMKLTEEKIGDYLECSSTGGNFLKRTPLVQELRSNDV